MSLEELTVKLDFTYEEYPVRILETTERVTRSWIFRMYKSSGISAPKRRLFVIEKRI
jgi:hypothetical protein